MPTINCCSSKDGSSICILLTIQPDSPPLALVPSEWSLVRLLREFAFIFRQRLRRRHGALLLNIASARNERKHFSKNARERMVGGLARVCAVRTTTGADERKKRSVVAGQFFVGARSEPGVSDFVTGVFPGSYVAWRQRQSSTPSRSKSA